MKYHNKRISLGGHNFASKAEAARWIYLSALERDGGITHLRLQSRYELYAGIFYVADFEYFRESGISVVEDVKGLKTDVFKLKAKMFQAKYGKQIREIQIGSHAADCLIKAYLGQERREKKA